MASHGPTLPVSNGTPVVPRPQPWIPWVAGALTLILLGGAVLFTRGQLRVELRNQLANRDAQILRALLQRQLSGLASNPDSDPLLAVLDASTLPEVPGIVGIRLFTDQGAFFTGLLSATNESSLPSAAIQSARAGTTTSRFHAVASDTTAGILANQGKEALLEIVVPLPDSSGKLVGIAQFFFDGTNLAAEFSTLDQNLRRQALLAFVLAAAAISAALAFAFHRLSQTTRLLSERTQSLQRANQELTLAAKTSAIGAVTSHLLHGLKNPLAGLQQFVSARPGSSQDPASTAAIDEEWRDAANTTRRMRAMIEGVMQVLREESSGVSIQVPIAEIPARLGQKFAEAMRTGQLQWQSTGELNGELSSREANLVVLILENLIGNAIQASPKGGIIRLHGSEQDGTLVFRVRDEGPGLPPHIRQRLFTPVQSTKEGGSGIGLALSQQLAHHLGADLTLVSSDSTGTEFALRLPAACGARAIG